MNQGVRLPMHQSYKDRMLGYPLQTTITKVLLGMRVAKQKAPNMTLETHNARKIYKHNNTQVFMDAVLNAPEDRKFLRSTARIMNGKGHEKQRQEVQVNTACE